VVKSGATRVDRWRRRADNQGVHLHEERMRGTLPVGIVILVVAAAILFEILIYSFLLPVTG
jgi:hypothetical protein